MPQWWRWRECGWLKAHRLEQAANILHKQHTEAWDSIPYWNSTSIYWERFNHRVDCVLGVCTLYLPLPSIQCHPMDLHRIWGKIPFTSSRHYGIVWFLLSYETAAATTTQAYGQPEFCSWQMAWKWRKRAEDIFFLSCKIEKRNVSRSFAETNTGDVRNIHRWESRNE